MSQDNVSSFRQHLKAAAALLPADSGRKGSFLCSWLLIGWACWRRGRGLCMSPGTSLPCKQWKVERFSPSHTVTVTRAHTHAASDPGHIETVSRRTYLNIYIRDTRCHRVISVVYCVLALRHPLVPHWMNDEIHVIFIALFRSRAAVAWIWAYI